MTPTAIYLKHPDYVQRDVAGECILVPLKRTLTASNCIYVLNETGAAFWRQLDGQRATQAIVEGLLGEYDVQPDQLAKDLAALIDDLLSISAITTVGASTCNP